MAGQWRHNCQRGTGMQNQYNYVTLSALPELIIMYTLVCIHENLLVLRLYQLIICVCSPDVKASIK